MTELTKRQLSLPRTLIRDGLQERHGSNDRRYGSDDSEVGLYRIEDYTLDDETTPTFVFGLFDRSYGDGMRDAMLMGSVIIELNRAASYMHIVNVYVDVKHRGERWCTVMLTEAIRSVIDGEEEKPHEAEVEIDSYYPMAATMCYFHALEANEYDFVTVTWQQTPVGTVEEYVRKKREEPWVEHLRFVAVTAVTEELPLPTAEEYERVLERLAPQLITGLRDTDVRKELREADTDVLKKAKPLALVYGEVNAKFMRWMIGRLKIGADDVFVDIGSGTGNVVAYVAAVTGAEAVGVEINPNLDAAARRNLLLITGQLRVERRNIGGVYLMVGDAKETLKEWPPQAPASIVFTNNVVIDDDVVRAIIKRMLMDGHIVGGTRLLLMKPLLWGKSLEDDEVMRYVDFSENVAPRIMETPKDVVSWVYRGFEPVLYVIAKTKSDDLLFRSRYKKRYLDMLKKRSDNMGERPSDPPKHRKNRRRG